MAGVSTEEEIDWWQRQADVDKDDAGYDISSVALLIQKWYGPTKGTFLDLGCGRGRLTNLIGRMSAKWRIRATDVSLGAILQARRDSPLNVTYRMGNGSRVPFARTEGLDGAWAVALFQHLPDEQRWDYIRDVYSRLKRGATFSFTIEVGDNDGFAIHQIPDLDAYIADLEGLFSYVNVEPIDANGWTWIRATK